MSDSSTDAAGPEPQIEESAPGSSTDENDGITQHLDAGDTLSSQSIDSVLDAGWIPPDRDPGIDVPTVFEQEAGESLEDKLAQEVPDVGDQEPLTGEELDAGGERAGRLTDLEDPTGSLTGEDVGIDGAAATAEEAAIHII